ncbi:hypothetical protein ACFL6D_00900 [Spirochaetota bacterium]
MNNLIKKLLYISAAIIILCFLCLHAQVAWEQATANGGFAPRYGHTSAVFMDNIWIIGGAINGIYDSTNDIWFSTNGIAWTYDTNVSTMWQGYAQGAAVYNDELWVFGGCEGFPHQTMPSSADFFNADGITWNPGMPYFPPISDMPILVYNNVIWLIGGMGDYGDLGAADDIQYTDAPFVNWYTAAITAPFGSRYGNTALVFNELMWVIAGKTTSFNVAGGYMNDVWHSSDGTNWDLATDNAAFSPRENHSSVVYDNKMWVIGGYYSNGGGEQFYNDVWYSDDGISWIQLSSNAGFEKRKEHSSVVYDDKIFVIGGIGSGSSLYNDVWYLRYKLPKNAQQVISPDQNSWELISFYVYPYITAANSIFTGIDQSVYVYTWDPAQEYDDYFMKYVVPGDFKKGVGYWVYGESLIDISKTGDTFVDTSIEISLKGGEWNLAGNPFPFPVDLSYFYIKKDNTTVSFLQSDAVDKESIHIYMSKDDVKQYIQINELSAIDTGLGFWVYALSDCTLIMKPVKSFLPLQSPSLSSYIQHLGTDWGAALSCEIDGRADTYNFLGAASYASDAFSSEDTLEPPVQSGYVSLYFNESDMNLTKNIKSTDAPVHVWDFTVKSDIGNRNAVLSWHSIKNIPKDEVVFSIKDIESGKVIDPYEEQSYSYTTSIHGGERRFQIKAADPFYKDLITKAFDIENLKLYPNPAPSGTGVKVSFLMTENASVRFTVYDIARNVVYNKKYNAEVFSASAVSIAQVFDWDSRLKSGLFASPGVYLYKIEAVTPLGEKSLKAGKFVISE